MPLKIIHHQEAEEQQIKKQTLNLNIEECLQKMFSICNKIVNFSNKILENIETNKFLHDITNEDIEEYSKMIDLFSMICGKKMSVIDAIVKTTTIIQKIQILSEKFGVSLIKQDVNENEETLTDEDIDMIVNMVKDFGEEQIREDVKNCKIELDKENIEQAKKENKKIDVYDIYNNDE